MAQRKKQLLTALFVIFTAVVSLVAGGILLSSPKTLGSSAKDEGDGASLTLYFYLNGGVGRSGVFQNTEYYTKNANQTIKGDSHRKVLAYLSCRVHRI